MSPMVSLSALALPTVLRVFVWITFAGLVFMLAVGVFARLTERYNLSGLANAVAGVLALTLVVELLIGVSVRGERSHGNTPPTGPEVVRVEVLAQRYSWTFRLPGDDGAFGTPDDVVTHNTVTLPVGRPVVFALRSRDVLHGFHAPLFGARRDAIPGRTTHVWFTATHPGEVTVACSTLCGAAHYQMQASMLLASGPDFDAHTNALSLSQRSQREERSDGGTVSSDGLSWPWTWP